MENPPLRAYFFDRKPSAPTDADRSVVITLAELLADVLECELQVAGLLPDFRFAHSWHRWPAHMLEQSPVLVEVVESHPDWWPTLHQLWRSAGESGPAAVTHPLTGAAAATSTRVPRRRR